MQHLTADEILRRSLLGKDLPGLRAQKVADLVSPPDTRNTSPPPRNTADPTGAHKLPEGRRSVFSYLSLNASAAQLSTSILPLCCTNPPPAKGL